MKTFLMSAAVLAAAMSGAAAAQTTGGLAFAGAVGHTAAMTAEGDFTLVGQQSLMEINPRGEGGLIRAIVEIPTGTSAKWEVSKEAPNTLYWELKNDAPRIVNYLGYPGNYGAIPGTALPKELGGDGDPLDVIILGQAAPRGELVDVRLIGVLKMLDGGEQDDKLIAVLTENSPFAAIESMAQLDASYPGVSEIIGTWFANYKGPDGGMESQGFAEADVARQVFEAAAAQYKAGN